jgi:perosamine synthetase
MTNIVAAIGLAQIERLEAILARKRAIAAGYRDLLAGLPITFQQSGPGVDSSAWLVTILLPRGADRERLMSDMSARGIDTRPTFYCAHQMPMYEKGERLPVSEDISARGLSLPSFPSLTNQDVQRVAGALSDALTAQDFV